MRVCTFSSRIRLLSSAIGVHRKVALLLVADERVTRSILTIALIEDHNWIVYRKLDFMLGDAAPDTDQ